MARRMQAASLAEGSARPLQQQVAAKTPPHLGRWLRSGEGLGKWQLLVQMSDASIHCTVDPTTVGSSSDGTVYALHL
jgi:hypothetical protein